MRSAWVAFALAVAGCGDGRSVLHLTVDAVGALGEVGGLRLQVVDHGTTPPRRAAPLLVPAGPTLPPAVRVALVLGREVRGRVEVQVEAMGSDGRLRAGGSAERVITPGGTFDLLVRLVGGAGVDLGPPDDGRALDLALLDGPRGGGVDGITVDQAIDPPDLTTPGLGEGGVPADLAPPLDLAVAPDLAPSLDLAAPIDVATPPDLATIADWSPPLDLVKPIDLTAPPDHLVVPDFSSTPDLTPRPDLVVSGRWLQADMAHCPDFCRARGMASAPGPEGSHCMSGEARAASGIAAGIRFTWGCWRVCTAEGAQQATTTPNGYCFRTEAAKDYDVTDRTVGCFCR